MEIGTIVAGKYLLDRVVGHGGMGLVVQATHLQLHQPVAIKFLLPGASQNAEAVQRFLREARAAARLRSEHVAQVFDVGTHNGTPYIVLEYLEGTDLACFPRAQLTIGTLIDLLLQACEALGEAHAAGIVHRDIKPANFFITRSPGGALCLKLLDFGVSKTIGATGKLTASRVMLGTPVYMSPEQMRTARDVDARSDIWSLGVVLYEMLEGAPPFETAAFSAMVLKIVNDSPPRLTARLPAGLDRIVYQCLEKNPGRRFQSTAELAAELAPYAGSPAQAAITLERTRGLHASPRHVATAAPDDLASPVPASTTVRHAARRRRRLWIAAGLLVGAGAAFVAIERSTAAEPRAPAGRFSPAAASLIVATPPAALATPARPEPDSPPQPGQPAPASDVDTHVVPLVQPARARAAEQRGQPPESPARRPKRLQHTSAVKAKQDPSPVGVPHDNPPHDNPPHDNPPHDNRTKETRSPHFDRGD